MAIIERQPEQRKRPDLVALNFLLQTGQLMTSGKTELSEEPPPVVKYETASSAVLLILKN